MVVLIGNSMFIFFSKEIFISKFSFSSDNEFDQPIREFIEKTLSEPTKKKNSSSTSTVSNAFANEMEDELDQIYHNFISRGTFELPISSKSYFNLLLFVFLFFFVAQKKEEKKKIAINEQEENDSDDEDDEPSMKFLFDKKFFININFF